MNVRTVLIVLAAVTALLPSTVPAEAAVPAEWQTKTPAELVTLAGQFAQAGTEGQTNRALLIEHLATKYIADATAIKTVTPAQWHALGESLAGDMTDETKAQWAGKLRTAFVGSTDALAAISYADFAPMAALLSRLRDKGVPTLRSAFVDASTAWKTFKPGDFAWLVWRMDRGQTGASARAKLVNHITTTYLKDAAAVKLLVPAQWGRTVNMLRGELSDGAKAQWIAALRSAYAGTNEAVAAMNAEGRKSLTSALRALGDKQANNLHATFIEESDGWKTYDAGKFLELVRAMGPLGQVGSAARGRLAAHAKAKFLTDDQTARTMVPQRWVYIVRILAPSLSAADKTLWIARLRSAFAGTPDVFGALSARDRNNVSTALRVLGDKNTGDIKEAFVNGSTAWHSSDAGQLFDLLRSLGTSDTSLAAKGRIVDQITAKYAASDAAAIGVGISRWGSIVRSSRGVLSAKTMGIWATRLRSAFAAKDMKARELFSLLGTLKSLGETDSVGFVTAWMAQRNSWQSWTVAEHAALAKTLAGSQNAAAPLSQIEQVAVGRIADAEAMRTTGHRPWLRLVQVLAPSMSAETEAAWALAMRQAFAPSAAALEALPARDCAGLMSILVALGDANAASLALTWLKGTNRNAWSEERLADVISAVAAAGSADKTAVVNAMNELGTLALSGEMMVTDRLHICRAFVVAWVGMKDMGLAQQWAMRAYEIGVGTEAARAAATARTVSQVAGALKVAGLVGPDKSYPAYAATLARLAREGKIEVCALPWYAPQQALPIGTASTRETVQGALLDTEGNPRLAIAKILAWSYRNADALKTWRAVVDAELAKEAVTGDTRALWLMIDAYNRAIVPFEPAARWGIGSLTQALGCAQSEPVRLDVIRQIGIYYRQMKQPQAAVGVIESIKNQFTGDALAEVEAIRKGLAAAAAAARAEHEVRERAIEARQRKTTLARYRQALVVAEASGDERRAQKLRAAIEKLEQ